ncbi:MAG: hypothetical protein FVQ77_04390 [Cytophagales bacterium]|nr:hypothetical protein [Cytophagales bacterium]
MAKQRVLITVKTYPTISKKYDEIVCTAGFTAEGKWIRLYPIPFRKLDYVHQYKKYDWVEMDLTKNTSDFRPESYRPVNIDVDEPVKVVGHIETKDNWAERKNIVLNTVYDDLERLILEAKDKKVCTSLAVFKPTKIHDFICEAVEREWDNKKKEQLLQMKLFEQKRDFEVVRKLPYKFSYVFEDVNGKKPTLMIEDWEIGALYWNCLARNEGDEKAACKEVIAKYFDDFAKTKDLYFFLGTTKVNHFVAKNPFIIIGTFHPKPVTQLKLDL